MMVPHRNFYVYEHREADTGRTFYVGKGSGKRAWGRSSRNRFWRNIAAKHGFTVHLIYEGLSEDMALRLEVLLTEAHGMENLATLVVGGAGTSGYRHTPEVRARFSELRLGKSLPLLSRQRMSATIRSRPDLLALRRDRFAGDANPSKRTENREVSSRRMREANPMNDLGKRAKMAAKLKGRKRSIEERAAQKERMRLWAAPLRGVPRNPVTVEKMRLAMSKYARAVETLCGMRFESTKAAAQATGVRQGNIVNCCRGRAKTAGGYGWRYADSGLE